MFCTGATPECSGGLWVCTGAKYSRRTSAQGPPKTFRSSEKRHPNPNFLGQDFGNGPNTVSGSTVSNTELSEFFWAR